MLQYLISIREFFVKFKSGLTANAADWAGEPETPAVMQGHIDDVDTADAEVTAAEIALTQKRTAAREVRESKKGIIKSLGNRVKGIYPDNMIKWPEFNVSIPTINAPDRPAPSYQHNVNLIDDTDGQGFIISIQNDELADYYEWEKGRSENASDVNTIPQMVPWRTNSKIKLVDDDVEKGVRYWYRVRSVNSHGVGPWSEPASRVQ